jgi:hypothetical protein
VNEKREQLLAIREAQPADGAIAISDDSQPSIGTDIDVLGIIRSRLRPEFTAQLIE